MRCGLAGLPHTLAASADDYLKKITHNIQLSATAVRLQFPQIDLRKGDDSIIMRLTKLGSVSKPSTPDVFVSDMQTLKFPQSTESHSYSV